MTAPDFAPANFSGNSGRRTAFRSALLLTLLRLFAELLKRLARDCHQLLVRCAVHRRRGVQAVAQKRQGDQVLSRQTHMSQSPTGKPAGLFWDCQKVMLFDKAAAVCCAYKAAENGAYALLRGTACIDYRNLQKIGLPKRKTEQRSFQNMKATGIVRRIDD